MPPDLGVKLRKLPETLLQSLGGTLCRFAPLGHFKMCGAHFHWLGGQGQGQSGDSLGLSEDL